MGVSGFPVSLEKRKEKNITQSVTFDMSYYREVPPKSRFEKLSQGNTQINLMWQCHSRLCEEARSLCFAVHTSDDLLLKTLQSTGRQGPKTWDQHSTQPHVSKEGQHGRQVTRNMSMVRAKACVPWAETRCSELCVPHAGHLHRLLHGKRTYFLSLGTRAFVDVA